MWIGAGLALAILFAISCIQFRQAGLAAVAALAALPGYVPAIAFHAQSHTAGYLLGFLICGIFLSAVETRICESALPADAVRQALRDSAAAMLWPLALVLVIAAIFAIVSGSAVFTLALPVAFSAASVFAIALPAARYLAYGDEFIVRANRLRERRERWLDGLAFTVQPRWGWSVTGIALIFTVLGCFGGSGAATSFPAAVLLADALLFAVVAFASVRNIRRAAAFLVSAASLVSVGFWMWERMPASAPDMILAGAVAATPALVMAIRSAKFARKGDTAAVASLRASEQFAVEIIFFCLGSAGALMAVGAWAAGILIALGGVWALIVFPAITTAIHDLFPARLSQDAYRIR